MARATIFIPVFAPIRCLLVAASLAICLGTACSPRPPQDAGPATPAPSPDRRAADHQQPTGTLVGPDHPAAGDNPADATGPRSLVPGATAGRPVPPSGLLAGKRDAAGRPLPTRGHAGTAEHAGTGNLAAADAAAVPGKDLGAGGGAAPLPPGGVSAVGGGKPGNISAGGGQVPSPAAATDGQAGGATNATPPREAATADQGEQTVSSLVNAYRSATDAMDREGFAYELESLGTPEVGPAFATLAAMEKDEDLKGLLLTLLGDSEAPVETKLAAFAEALRPGQPETVREAASESLQSVEDARAVQVWRQFENDPLLGDTARDAIESLGSTPR